MAKIQILVAQADDTVKSSCDLSGASIADLTIIERLLRRHLVQVINESNALLDKDTKGKKIGRIGEQGSVEEVVDDTQS